MKNFLLPLVCAAVSYAANPVYVAASYGLYKSTDTGTTWTMVNIPLNNPLLKAPITMRRLTIDPGNPSKIYCIGSATALAFFATADGGQTWTATPFVGMSPRDLDVDFAGQVLYVSATATSSSGDNLLYSSTNAGATWTRLRVPLGPGNNTAAFPNGSRIMYFAADTTVSGTVYVASDLEEFFKSTDFGQTWTFVAKQIKLGDGSIAAQTLTRGIKQDPRNPKIWYNSGDHSNFPQSCPLTNGGLCGLFKSTDGGATFTGLNIPTNYVNGFAISAPSSTLYAVGDVVGLGGTVLKSTNGGDTWTPIKNGLFGTRSGRVWADPNDASTVYVNDSATNQNFYVSTDAGANYKAIPLPVGPPGCVPGNCQRQEVHDLAIAPSTQPVITSVVNGASLLPGIAPNTWVTIFGSNLAPITDNWNNSIVNGNLPTGVDGVSASMGGKAAYVYFISSGQLNVLAPPDLPAGPVTVTVTTPVGTSAGFTATASQFSPAFFTWPGNQAVATRQDFSFAVRPGTFPGATTVAAKPGDVLILWATGFGPTNPVAPAGVATPGDKTYAAATTPTINIDNSAVVVFGAALAPGSAGLYQIAIQVPGSIADGDYAIQAVAGGVQSPTGVVISVRK